MKYCLYLMVHPTDFFLKAETCLGLQEVGIILYLYSSYILSLWTRKTKLPLGFHRYPLPFFSKSKHQCFIRILFLMYLSLARRIGMVCSFYYYQMAIEGENGYLLVHYSIALSFFIASYAFNSLWYSSTNMILHLKSSKFLSPSSVQQYLLLFS